MAYDDELLDHAFELVHRSPPTQLTLRRAVSAAYYAVFHLLIAEATANWGEASLRTALARAYDHATMKAASHRILNKNEFPFSDEDPVIVTKLRFIAQTFIQLQQDRHFADYNLTKDLGHAAAILQVKSAEEIFNTWPSISGYRITQAYLVSLLVRRP